MFYKDHIYLSLSIAPQNFSLNSNLSDEKHGLSLLYVQYSHLCTVRLKKHLLYHEYVAILGHKKKLSFCTACICSVQLVCTQVGRQTSNLAVLGGPNIRQSQGFINTNYHSALLADLGR